MKKVDCHLQGRGRRGERAKNESMSWSGYSTERRRKEPSSSLGLGGGSCELWPAWGLCFVKRLVFDLRAFLPKLECPLWIDSRSSVGLVIFKENSGSESGGSAWLCSLSFPHTWHKGGAISKSLREGTHFSRAAAWPLGLSSPTGYLLFLVDQGLSVPTGQG